MAAAPRNPVRITSFDFMLINMDDKKKKKHVFLNVSEIGEREKDYSDATDDQL